MLASREQILGYYNSFSAYLQKTGVNVRHRTIFYRLIKNGLKRNSSVLEIGCGIGQVTKLMAGFLTSGSITAVDISEQNVKTARAGLKSHDNVTFLVSDMTDFSSDKKFDVLVLPDVLEHRPLEQHANLFDCKGRHTHSDSIVFINIPSPHCQYYIPHYKPELQQIVDLSLWTNLILPSFQAGGFNIHSLINYSLAFKEYDYQEIVLKMRVVLAKVTYLSKFDFFKQELRMKLRMFF